MASESKVKSKNTLVIPSSMPQETWSLDANIQNEEVDMCSCRACVNILPQEALKTNSRYSYFADFEG